MSDDHPRWRPPAGTQSMPGSGGIEESDEGLASAMTQRVDKPAAMSLDAAAVLEQGETFKNGAIIGERYVIETHISSGSFGAVYKARDKSIENHAVALKVLHGPSATAAARKKALRELQLIASVSHPSVVQFKDYGWIGDTLWFTMPWYDGRTLFDRLEDGGKEHQIPLDRAEARPIFERLAHGLAAMHEVGVFHHDIKPENIFLATVSGFDGGLPVLLDLGIASKRGEKPVGFTAKYVSPETASAAMGNKAKGIGAAADVYSLALALRNSLEPETAPKFEGDHFYFLNSRATEPVKPPSSRDLRYLAPSFRRWLSLKPEDRPTAEAFADELKILTAPEDRRRARVLIVRRLVPIVLLAAVLVSVLAYQLTRKQELLIEKEERLSEKDQQLSQKSMEADLLANKTVEQQEQIETEAARAAESERIAKKLDKKLEKTSKAQDRLNMKLEELQVVHLDLLASNDTLTAEHEKLRADHTGLVAKHNELTANMESLRSERDQLQASNKTLQTELEGAKNTQNALKAEIETFKKQIEDLKKKIEELKKKLLGLKTKKPPPEPIPATMDGETEVPNPEPPSIDPS